jgi:hypothetical protein
MHFEALARKLATPNENLQPKACGSVRIVGAEAVISTNGYCIDRKDDDPV